MEVGVERAKAICSGKSELTFLFLSLGWSIGNSSLPRRRDGSNRRVNGSNGPSKVVGIASPVGSNNEIDVKAIVNSKVVVGMMNNVAGGMIVVNGFDSHWFHPLHMRLQFLWSQGLTIMAKFWFFFSLYREYASTVFFLTKTTTFLVLNFTQSEDTWGYFCITGFRKIANRCKI